MWVSAVVKVVLYSFIWFLMRKDLMSRVCVAAVISFLGDYQLQIAGMEEASQLRNLLTAFPLPPRHPSQSRSKNPPNIGDLSISESGVGPCR